MVRQQEQGSNQTLSVGVSCRLDLARLCAALRRFLISPLRTRRMLFLDIPSHMQYATAAYPLTHTGPSLLSEDLPLVRALMHTVVDEQCILDVYIINNILFIAYVLLV